MDFREMAQEMILCALNCGLSSSSGPMYKKAVKRELIGQYAEVFWLNGKEKKFYGTFNTKEEADRPWEVILVSKNFDKSIRENFNEFKPYYEHIEPISYTYANLCSLKSPCMVGVKDCMKFCKIVGLTKKESTLLDSKRFTEFTEADEEIIESWEKVIGQPNCEEAINSMRNRMGKYNSCKSNGTAYARLAHLAAYGVQFVWGADPFAREGKSQIEIIKDYLDNTNYRYEFDSTTDKWI